EAWRSNQAWEATALRIRRQAIDVLSGLLDALVEAGELRSDLDTGVAGSAMFGMALTAALEWRTLTPDRPLDEVHAAVMRRIDALLAAERPDCAAGPAAPPVPGLAHAGRAACGAAGRAGRRPRPARSGRWPKPSRPARRPSRSARSARALGGGSPAARANTASGTCSGPWRGRRAPERPDRPGRRTGPE